MVRMATLPRSLADDLRQRDDAALALLLTQRPDLAHPLPSDLGQLAARSVTQAATARAVDRLDTWNLQVLAAVCVLPEPATVDMVTELFPDTDRSLVSQAITNLVEQALLWGTTTAWRATASAKEALGRFPAGLGPTYEDLSVTSPPRDVGGLLAEAPGDVLDLLGQLAWGPPTGRIDNAHRTVTVTEAATPVEWLLARQLLIAVDPQTIVLPREVGLHLRQGRLYEVAQPHLPAPDLQPGTAESVDRAAAGTAFEVVRRVENLLELWSTEGPAALRAGGVGVRDLRRAAERLDVDEPTAALLIEVAHAAGLLATSGDADDTWLPTPAYDIWRTQDTGHRWVELVQAWFETTRVPGLVGTRDNKQARVNVLAPDIDRVVAPDIRMAVLVDLADTTPGTGVSLQSLTLRQEWRRSRRGDRLRDSLVAWTLSESTALGVCALGALSTPSRRLLADDIDGAIAELGRYLPEPVGHVLLQADLTAIAPGPLESDVGRELSLLADVESSGGATVFRFSEGSVRRGLDAGRSALDIHGFLAEHSRTPVPQPLTYLVDDVARRHGRIRVGAASSYVRSDDPAVIDELLADRRTDPLRLRRLATTVASAQATPDVVLDRLRQLGLVPAAESPDGSMLVRRPDARRTGPRQRPPRLRADPPVPPRSVAEAAVRAMRSGERGGAVDGSTVGPAATTDLPRTAVNETLDVLRQAIAGKQAVWLGYVSTDGVAAERVVDPVDVRGGWLTAFDQRVERVRTFAVHRITGVALLDSTPG